MKPQEAKAKLEQLLKKNNIDFEWYNEEKHSDLKKHCLTHCLGTMQDTEEAKNALFQAMINTYKEQLKNVGKKVLLREFQFKRDEEKEYEGKMVKPWFIYSRHLIIS